MPAYTLDNSRGVTVAIINVGTTTGVTFPIEIQGQGIAPYGTIYGESIYHLMENFANTIEPVNPVEGMDFYNADKQLPHFHDGAAFVPYLTQGNASAGRFEMLPTATGIDMTNIATIPLFTAPGDGSAWLPTMLVLVSTTVDTVAGPAHVSVSIDPLQEDILEQTMVANPGLTTAHQYRIEGSTRFATGIETISMDITVPAPATALVMNAFLFGFNNRT